MKKFFALLGLTLLVLAAVVLGRTLAFRPPPRSTLAFPPADTMVDDAAAAARLARAVRWPTVSYTDSAPPSEPFLALHRQLEADFPRVHKQLAREIVPPFNLLFTWRGLDTTLAPVVIMGHLDVVPVQAAALSKWKHAPFSGDIAEGFVWGRGTLDDKVSVLAALEAVETLLTEGYQPVRTVYLAFGDDEEVSGRGAKAIVDLFKARGIHPEFVMDEGGAIVEGMMPGVMRPVALIGVAEKGYATAELTVEGEGGHSSMPPKETAVGVLASGIVALEQHPFAPRLSGPTGEMFDVLAREMPFGPRILFANRWLFDPLITRMLGGSPTTSALMRTTTAPTMFEGSPKDNVLPMQARAAVNFRIIPGNSVADVLAHVNSVIGDPRVVAKIDARSASEPSPVSGTETVGFRGIKQAAEEAFPGVLATPWLVVGATDARHYAAITPNAYRFLSVQIGQSDIARIHGIDERVSIAGYGRAVRFVRRLLRITTSGSGPK